MSQTRGTNLEPVGAAQGWSPASYADSVKALQDMGYRAHRSGRHGPAQDSRHPGLPRGDRRRAQARHRTPPSRASPESSRWTEFASHGVTSFDSTSAFRQAFMDDRKNYHTTDDAYVAIRVPQVDGNPTLKTGRPGRTGLATRGG